MKDYVGESRIMNNGLRATCIAFRSRDDCDFEFENGVIRKNVKWNSFIRNKLGLKSVKELNKDANIKGLRRQMKSGEFATCIEYRNNADIDVVFDDGTVLYNKTKQCFMNGDFVNPNSISRFSLIGVEKTMNCGMKAVCIADNGHLDITILFEDGTEVKTTRQCFNLCSVANPTLGKYYTVRNKNNFVGLEKVMNCGFKCKITKCDFVWDITVQFEDGSVVEHRYKSEFDRGTILHPKLDRGYTNRNNHSILGQSKVMNDGSTCKVIEYINCDNITVLFDTGTVLKNRTKGQFELGQIHNPDVLSVRTQNSSLVGLSARMNNGMFAECIEDFGENNITVEFDDGYIAYHRSRYHFLNGEIANPNILHNVSLPQCILYFYVRKYFSDALNNYRPDWMRLKDGIRNSELDIYIPSIKVSIEYDGSIDTHTNFSEHNLLKAEHINNLENINKHITILEKGCLSYGANFNKFIYYRLSNTSRGYTKDYFNELKSIIVSILIELGISNPEVTLSNKDLSIIYERRLNNYGKF